MSEISGDTTTVSPSRASAGNWKQSDLPPPVGNKASTSRPAKASRMISSCNGRKESKPKDCFSNGSRDVDSVFMKSERCSVKIGYDKYDSEMTSRFATPA